MAADDFARRLHGCINLGLKSPGVTLERTSCDHLSSPIWLNSESLYKAHVTEENREYTFPLHWGLVEDGVYRSGFPVAESFATIRRLGVRTVINLQDRLPLDYKEFLAEESISYIHTPVKGNKVHPEEMDRGHVSAALAIISDSSMHPILIHCRSGKHRTGALVGCLRMLQRWNLVEACEEYSNYTFYKQRFVDKQFIERFDPRAMAPLMPPPHRLPPWLLPSCVEHVSALEAAIRDGLITPERADEGLRVPAIVRGPDEPDFGKEKRDPPVGGSEGGLRCDCICTTPLALSLRRPMSVKPLVGGLFAIVFGKNGVFVDVRNISPWTCSEDSPGLNSCDPSKELSCTTCPTCSVEKK